MLKMASTCSAAEFANLYEANEIDCIAAMARLASHSTKASSSSGMQPVSQAVIIELFKSNPSIFADIFSKLPEDDNKALRKALNSSDLDWEATLDSTYPDGHVTPRSNAPKSSTEAFDLAVSGVGDEFDDDFAGSDFDLGKHESDEEEDEGLDQHTPAVATRMPDTVASHQNYNPTEYQDDGAGQEHSPDANGGADVDGSNEHDDEDGVGQDGDGYQAVVFAQDFALNDATDVRNDIVPMLEEFILATKM
jgi:hypothetical protein